MRVRSSPVTLSFVRNYSISITSSCGIFSQAVMPQNRQNLKMNWDRVASPRSSIDAFLGETAGAGFGLLFAVDINSRWDLICKAVQKHRSSVAQSKLHASRECYFICQMPLSTRARNAWNVRMIQWLQILEMEIRLIPKEVKEFRCRVFRSVARTPGSAPEICEISLGQKTRLPASPKTLTISCLAICRRFWPAMLGWEYRYIYEYSPLLS